MSLITEDGSGLSNAESYISVANADTRHSNNGNTDWALLSTSDKEAALRRATQFIEQRYRDRWQGYRVSRDQGLSWPRYYVWVDGFPVDSTVVPADVGSACADLALKAAAGDLNADLSTRVVSETVGPISTEYSPYSPQSVRYPAIDQMLAPFLEASGTAALVRR